MTLSKFSYIFVSLGLILTVFSCKKKQESDDIVVDKIVEKPQDGPISMENSNESGNVRWISGNGYSYSISRSTDSSRVVMNHEKEYRDNNITLVVKRQNGSEFFKKTFSKENFSNVLPHDMLENGVLLAMRMDKVEGNNMNFVVSVGSPDETNEEFYYVKMTLNNQGQTSASEYHGDIGATE